MNLALGLVETAIFSGKALTAINTAGTNLIINTITTTTTSIFGVLKTITTTSGPKVKEYIDQIKVIDLEFTITILDQLVKEQEDKVLQESVKRALVGVNEILLNIHKELKILEESIRYHNTKYFNDWRSFSSTASIELIKQHNDILKNRYNMLFELLKIYSKDNQ